MIHQIDSHAYFFLGKPDDFFVFRILFRSPLFKEIKQIQAYSVETLVGNVGGSIGFFLGYAIKEIPTFLHKIYKVVKKN